MRADFKMSPTTKALIWLTAFAVCFVQNFPVVQAAEKSSLRESTYFVQLSAFKSKSNAESLMDKLGRKGYRLHLKAPFRSSGWFKVMMGPYASRRQADAMESTLLKKENIHALVVKSSFSRPNSSPVPIQVETRNRKAVKDYQEGTAADDEFKFRPLNESVDTVVSLFLSWKKAWQEKSVYAYLDFYSDEFQHDAESMEEWRESRIQALMKNNDISLEFEDIKILKGDEKVKMTFVQKYSSNQFFDLGEKTLIWKNEDGSWKIIEETWKDI